MVRPLRGRTINNTAQGLCVSCVSYFYYCCQKKFFIELIEFTDTSDTGSTFPDCICMAGGRPKGLSPAIHVLGRAMAVPGPFFFLNRRRRPSADALVRMAGDRSGSLTGSARQAPSLGPLFRARPHPGRCAGTSKGMRAPIGPLRSGFRPPPLAPAKGGAAGYGPPLLRGFGLPLRVTTPPGTQAPGSVGLGLSPPVPARRSAAVSAPRSPRYALRAARTAPALGPAARPWAAPGGPASRPTRHCGFASGPSAPEPRRVPPRRPLLVVAGRSVPSLRHVGRATGSAPPAWGLERPCGPLSPAPGPRRFWKKQPGG